MSVTTPRTAIGLDAHRNRLTLASSSVLAIGIVLASAYGLLAEAPYRGLPPSTVTSARAQDVCSVVVAVLLVVLARQPGGRAHLVRLALLAYVAYSYSIYLTGVPMNRVFLVYVLLVSVSGAAFLDGLFRLRKAAWPRVHSRRLESGTGWMLMAVAFLFAALWLSVLVPYAVGGAAPTPAGPGGAPYPVYVLDLVVALPCIAAVGVLLVRGNAIGGPLAVVALAKIVTLFTALWAGVVTGLLEGADVHLGADAVPSLLMLAASVVMVTHWLRVLSPETDQFVRPTFWES
jgi:hypothetical protein